MRYLDQPSFADYAARTPHSYGTGTGSTRGLTSPAPAPVTYRLTDADGELVKLPVVVEFNGYALLLDRVDGPDHMSGPHEREALAERGVRRGVAASRFGYRTVPA
jgi:hypothetical protein